MIVEPTPRGAGTLQPEVPVARVVRWYKGRGKQNPVDYWSQGSGLGGHPTRKGAGEVSGNIFLLTVILMMVLLFILISFGPLIVF